MCGAIALNVAVLEPSVISDKQVWPVDFFFALLEDSKNT